MRKYINIVGVGNRMAGTGKSSGKPYDFTPVAFTYDDKFTTGLKAATVNINADSLAGYVPAIGDSVEVVMHEDYKSGRVFIDAVL
jgi:hypothetical protein